MHNNDENFNRNRKWYPKFKKDTNWKTACFQQPPPAWCMKYEIESLKLCGIGKQQVRLTFCSSPAAQKEYKIKRCSNYISKAMQLHNNESKCLRNQIEILSQNKHKSMELCLVWDKKYGTCKWNMTWLMEKWEIKPQENRKIETYKVMNENPPFILELSLDHLGE